MGPNGTHLRLSEVREMLRLTHALHEVPPGPVARKRRLLEGLCRLLRADAGVCVLSESDAAPLPDAVAVSVVRYGMSEEDAHTVAARYRSVASASARRPRRSRLLDPHVRIPSKPADSHHLESVLDVPGMKVQACVALLRRRQRSGGFTRRDGVLLQFLHAETAWIYCPDLPLLSPDGTPLSPRQRQTLQLLLAGNSEKEVATEMRLSHNTVHHYVKALHRHFGVSSRSELLARWVRK
jgi:DNA-binding NarL/FixJ family response regulator